MAERRMFAKTIIDSDAFLDMPHSTQLLYFHLSMRADDDGFINKPKTIMRMCNCADDDIKLLVAKKFIIPFESGVVVIKHWNIHNYISKDRYTETKYKDEKNTLFRDVNGAYSTSEGIPLITNGETPVKREYSAARKQRIQAKKDSDLPYSFEYKIRKAFIGEACPICGRTMNNSNNLTKPTIQHNIPISKGGKHEINNISVICNSCNSSIQNRKITEPYNTEQVIEIWECIQSQDNPETQVRLGKDRIGKDRIDNNKGQKNIKFTPPTINDVDEYCNERQNGINAEAFIDFYACKGWMVGKNKMKDWKAAVRNWERNSVKKKPQNEKGRLDWIDEL